MGRRAWATDVAGEIGPAASDVLAGAPGGEHAGRGRPRIDGFSKNPSIAVPAPLAKFCRRRQNSSDAGVATAGFF